jgi:hypothetical protein
VFDLCFRSGLQCRNSCLTCNGKYFDRQLASWPCRLSYPHYTPQITIIHALVLLLIFHLVNFFLACFLSRVTPSPFFPSLLLISSNSSYWFFFISRELSFRFLSFSASQPCWYIIPIFVIPCISSLLINPFDFCHSRLLIPIDISVRLFSFPASDH